MKKLIIKFLIYIAVAMLVIVIANNGITNILNGKTEDMIKDIMLMCFVGFLFGITTTKKACRKKTNYIKSSQPQTNSTIEKKVKNEPESTITDYRPQRIGIRFSDIAGYEETKKSVSFMVHCLKNKKLLDEVGAKMPKGILLSGPPGTGKTFMARAIAGEAGVPFFSTNGSRFMDVYVGQGPRNVRALFNEARKNAPCVVFIDEIDAIGGTRDTGDSNSERRNTLNALLTELDGINGNTGILTIAATNMPQDLDPALVRAGRFDRKISMPLPDVSERIAILKIHCKNKQIGSDVNLNEIAHSTSGFSGSDLATLANEAALQAASAGRHFIEPCDFEKAIFQVVTEGEKKRSKSIEERKMVAYHEIGHALIIKLVLKQAVPYVTNIASTSGVGGFTLRSDNTGGMLSKKQMRYQIMVAYGGRAGEELFFGNKEEVTNGASSDIQKATKLIRQYIGIYGMSDSVGMLNMMELTGSSNDKNLIEEAKKLSTELYEETLAVLQKNKNLLIALSEALFERETLTDEDIEQIMKECNNATI